MFRAEPLVKIRLVLLASEVPDAALELARFGVYSPGQYAPEALTDNTAAAYRDAWQEAESRLSKLIERCGGMPDLVIPEGAAAPTLQDLEELNKWLKDVWNACQAAFEGEARVQEEVRHLDALEETLGRLERLNVDLAHLLRADSLLFYALLITGSHAPNDHCSLTHLSPRRSRHPRAHRAAFWRRADFSG